MNKFLRYFPMLICNKINFFKRIVFYAHFFFTFFTFTFTFTSCLSFKRLYALAAPTFQKIFLTEYEHNQSFSKNFEKNLYIKRMNQLQNDSIARIRNIPFFTLEKKIDIFFKQRVDISIIEKEIEESFSFLKFLNYPPSSFYHLRNYIKKKIDFCKYMMENEKRWLKKNFDLTHQEMIQDNIEYVSWITTDFITMLQRKKLGNIQKLFKKFQKWLVQEEKEIKEENKIALNNLIDESFKELKQIFEKHSQHLNATITQWATDPNNTLNQN